MGPYPLFAEVQKWVGSGQQDCHEVLIMLVDWLSEDLNRVQGRKVPIQVSLHVFSAILYIIVPVTAHDIFVCLQVGKACLYLLHASLLLKAFERNTCAYQCCRATWVSAHTPIGF